MNQSKSESLIHTAQSKVLIVVAKRPTPGETKTRLSPPLSPGQASALYECFLLDSLDLIRQVPGVRRVIAYLPRGEKQYFSRMAPDFELLEQNGLDLGERLDNALTHYLKMGYQKAVIMNSDSPTLPPSCLLSAFAALDDGSDAVIGPADDGGYYLIGIRGLRRPYHRLLREVRMSTPEVTANTLALAAEEGLQVRLLPEWYDVDDHRSLRQLLNELAESPGGIAPFTREYLAASQLDIREFFTTSPVANLETHSSV